MSIGIVSEDYPFWSWQVGTLGVVKWMISNRNLPGQTETDPPWRQYFPKLPKIKPVKVMLVHGAWPPTSKQVWKLNSLKVAIRINMCKYSRRKRQKVAMPMPERWFEFRRYLKTRDEVGGVTNGRF